MKRIAITVAICGLAGTPALAADMPTKAPYSPPGSYNWTGCYLGIKGVGAKGENDWAPVGGFANGTNGPSGFFGGGQVGCDHQTGPLVFGVGAAFDWGSAQNTVEGQGIGGEFETKLRTFGTAEGRVGYAFNRVLPYVQAGLAGAQFSHQIDAAAGADLIPA